MLVSAAHAQLVFGSTAPFSSSSPAFSGAYYLNLQTATATQLWTGASNKKVNGLAADNTNGILYGNDSARIYKWNYNSVGTAPTQINGLYRLGANNLVYATGVDGLASANGKVYAYTNFNAGVPAAAQLEDGIYEINTSITTSATPNMTLKWQHADLAYNLQGLDFNEADGLFYAANTSGANATGIYTVDVLGTGNITKIADFDSTFLPTADGLAVGGGHVWLTGKLSGDTALKIEGYNLSTHQFDEFFALDGFGTTARSTGATWAPNAIAPVPEPTTMAALGLGALALVRRRRK